MLKITFDRERETKNTVIYQERGRDDPPAVGTLYVQKFAVRRLGDPAVLEVTIEAKP